MTINEVEDVEQITPESDNNTDSPSENVTVSSIKTESSVKNNGPENSDLVYEFASLLFSDTSETLPSDTHTLDVTSTSSLVSQNIENKSHSTTVDMSAIVSNSTEDQKLTDPIEISKAENKNNIKEDHAAFEIDSQCETSNETTDYEIELGHEAKHLESDVCNSRGVCSATSSAGLENNEHNSCAENTIDELSDRANTPESNWLVRETEKRQNVERELEEMDFENEVKDSLGELHLYIPPIGRGRGNTNRLSVISMASSIAAIAPYINSHSIDTPEEASALIFSEGSREMEEFSFHEDMDKKRQFPIEDSSHERFHRFDDDKSTGRLSRLMQSAVLNANKKRNPEITERAMEEWSFSLENCFDSIREGSISFDIPASKTNLEEIPTFDSRNTYVSSRGVASNVEPKKNRKNPFSRISRMWYKSSSNNHGESEVATSVQRHNSSDSRTERPTTHTSESLLGNNEFEEESRLPLLAQNFDDSCSFVTAPDSDSDRDNHLSAHSAPPSLSITHAETSLDTNFTCKTIGENSLPSYKTDAPKKLKRKRNKISTMFRYLLGSSVSE